MAMSLSLDLSIGRLRVEIPEIVLGQILNPLTLTLSPRGERGLVGDGVMSFVKDAD
jgi:hypothetical protein